MQYKSILKNILLNHKFDYIVKPIISQYNISNLEYIINTYPNKLNSCITKWYNKDSILLNYFPHENCIVIHKEYNAFRGGLVYNIKYRPINNYERDYYLVDNVSIDNLIEYIENDLYIKLNQYYKPTPAFIEQNIFEYWFKVAVF